MSGSKKQPHRTCWKLSLSLPSSADDSPRSIPKGSSRRKQSYVSFAPNESLSILYFILLAFHPSLPTKRTLHLTRIPPCVSRPSYTHTLTCPSLIPLILPSATPTGMRHSAPIPIPVVSPPKVMVRQAISFVYLKSSETKSSTSLDLNLPMSSRPCSGGVSQGMTIKRPGRSRSGTSPCLTRQVERRTERA